MARDRALDRKVITGGSGSFTAGRSVCSPVGSLFAPRGADSSRSLARAVEGGTSAPPPVADTSFEHAPSAAARELDDRPQRDDSGGSVATAPMTQAAL